VLSPGVDIPRNDVMIEARVEGSTMRTSLSCKAALLTWMPFALPASAQDDTVVPSACVGPIAGAAGTFAYSSTPGVGSMNAANGFTSIEGMVPFFTQPERRLFFLDFRGLLSDAGHDAFNLGGGYRLLNPHTDRILGINAYFDSRDTGPATFQEFGGGFESFGRLVDVRGNFYLPLQSRFRVVSDHMVDGGTTSSVSIDTASPFFQRHNILFNEFSTVSSVKYRYRGYQESFNAFELEAGVPVPLLTRWLKVYGGVYDIEGLDSGNAVGARGRLEARFNDGVIASVAVQNDRIYDTSVMFQIAMRFGGGAWRRRPFESVSDRLLDRVERNTSVLVKEKVTVDTSVTTSTTNIGTIVAAHPNTGKPVVVDHVASSAPDGGDGTFEKPFNNLAALQTGSNPGDILFAWGGSVFSNQSIALQTGQRLLGEGIAHTFNSQLNLPRATASNVMPIINGARGAALTLADNTEISGFNITNSTGAAISGTNVTGVDINRNNFSSNAVADAATIILTYNAPGSYTSSVTGNTINTSNASGISVTIDSGTVVKTTIANNSILNSSSDGVDLQASGSGNLNAQVTGNTVTANGGAGISLFRVGTDISGVPRASATIANNTVTGSGLEGISIVDSITRIDATNNPLSVSILGNSTANNGGAGIFLSAQNNVNGQAGILGIVTNNTMTSDNVANLDAGNFHAQNLSFGGVGGLVRLQLGGNTSVTPANGVFYFLNNPTAGNTFVLDDRGNTPTGSITTNGTINSGTVP
jgi:hypothetical protein